MPPQKKIAFLITSLISGGEECNAAILAKYMSKKEELICVCFNGPIDFEMPANVRIIMLRPDYRWKLLRILTYPIAIWRYFLFCRKEKITHSIAFDTLPNFTNCLIRLLGGKGKIYLRVTNHITTRFPATTYRGLIFQWLIKKLYPQADGIFVNASRLATDLQDNYQIEAPIHLSYNPMDLSAIEYLKNSKISTDSVFTFIHVAMFRPQKNHQLLLQAFAKIKDLKVQLWLIGKGVLEQPLLDLVQKLDITKQVHFLGFQQNYYQYIAAADCLVMSSDYEGQCRVLSEGLACGLPIISTDCPSGPRETIAPDTNNNNQTTNQIELAKYGILTPVGNADNLAEAMTYLYQNDRYRKGDFYKKRVEEFRVEKVVGDLLEVMKEKNSI